MTVLSVVNPHGMKRMGAKSEAFWPSTGRVGPLRRDSKINFSRKLIKESLLQGWVEGKQALWVDASVGQLLLVGLKVFLLWFPGGMPKKSLPLIGLEQRWRVEQHFSEELVSALVLLLVLSGVIFGPKYPPGNWEIPDPGSSTDLLSGLEQITSSLCTSNTSLRVLSSWVKKTFSVFLLVIVPSDFPSQFFSFFSDAFESLELLRASWHFSLKYYCGTLEKKLKSTK